MAQTVKRLSTMQETRVRALGWEDALEKEVAIHSSTLSWEMKWIEKPVGYSSQDHKRVGHDLVTKQHLMRKHVSKR